MQDKKDNDVRKDAEPSFEQLLQESYRPAADLSVGDKVETRIVAIDNDFLYLDLGTRLEGTAKKIEFVEDGRLIVKEGDTVEVYVAGKKGDAYRCVRFFASAKSISTEVQGDSVPFALKDAFEHGVPVDGKVIQVIKGGFEIQVMGKKAFCPLSQIEISFCQNPEGHVGKTYPFSITRLEEEGRNIILSRKELLVEEERRKSEALWKKIQTGDVCKGVITAVKNYGAFVDIGGIQGLLHVSEISHSRIEDARQVLEEGQDLEVEIISVDLDKRKIGLSLKSRMEDPWETALKNISVGDQVEGKVVKMKSFGAFVEILPGLVGLLHISRLGTGKEHQHPKEVLHVGDTISVRILEIDEKKQNVALTMEKEDEDVGEELKKLKKEQEKKLESGPGYMENLLDDYLDKKDK